MQYHMSLVRALLIMENNVILTIFLQLAQHLMGYTISPKDH